MFLDYREKHRGEGKKGEDVTAAGLDLTDGGVLLSYCLPGRQPETVSCRADEEQYRIPAVLARCAERDVWLFGEKALEASENGEALLVSGLLEHAVRRQDIEVGEERFEAVGLLSLFLKRVLSLLAPSVRAERLDALVFSVEQVTPQILEALGEAAKLLGLPEAQIYVIGRAESFFYYNISQPEELWRRDVLLCDFTGSHLRTLIFMANKKTTPVACFVEEKDWPEVRPLSREKESEENEKIFLDRRFQAAVGEVLEGRNVSCVYLIGDGFDGEWYQGSLQFLCQDRRVFLGSNLYSKGACYAARQRLVPGGISDGYAFLGKDMLKANVGIPVTVQGQDRYLALLDAGVNWYEVSAETEFLLEDEESFSLRITPLDGKSVREVLVTLSGIPKRPARTTRIHLKADMTDVSTVRISMEDLGFGEFFPATHKFWEENIEL